MRNNILPTMLAGASIFFSSNLFANTLAHNNNTNAVFLAGQYGFSQGSNSSYNMPPPNGGQQGESSDMMMPPPPSGQDGGQQGENSGMMPPPSSGQNGSQ